MYLLKAGLQIDAELVSFIETEALTGTDIAPNRFWSGLAQLVSQFMPRNRELLVVRDHLQRLIDDWHRQNGSVSSDPQGYEDFLRTIGYLEDEPSACTIETSGLDPEVSALNGPQLVVPLSNARYALNAANARWGSLYDALYGTDAIGQAPDKHAGAGLNPDRASAVVEYGVEFLDMAFPLAVGTHREVTAYTVSEEGGRSNLVVSTASAKTGLGDPGQFVGFVRTDSLERILLRHHGLYVELLVDRSTPAGAMHAVGLADIIVESALTAIQDFEDSVAAVDAHDKVGVYRNWLGLMDGSLTESFDAFRH